MLHFINRAAHFTVVIFEPVILKLVFGLLLHFHRTRLGFLRNNLVNDDNTCTFVWDPVFFMGDFIKKLKYSFQLIDVLVSGLFFACFHVVITETGNNLNESALIEKEARS